MLLHASPTPSTSTPVAIGSSVPPCPTYTHNTTFLNHFRRSVIFRVK
jgi:hypothetical protein